MGLLDSMFGGWNEARFLVLDAPTASPGSVVSGRIDLGGGKKPLQLKELNVRFLYVRVETRPGQTLPNIEAKELTRLVIAAGVPIAPGSQQQFTFRLTVPASLPPTAHNVSFQIVATADIPGIKDPTAKVDVKVVEASKDKTRRLPLAEVLARFPDLQSRNEEALKKALYELHLACYAESGELLEVEPLVGQLMFQRTGEVRMKAIEAWGNLVDKHVEPQHLQALYAVANTPGLDEDTFEQVIIRGDQAR